MNLDILLRLPEDIYLDIFSRIPVKSLLSCKCVCKGWNVIISSSDFIHLHLNHAIQKNKPSLMLRLSKALYSDPDPDSGRDWIGTDGNIIYSVANGSLASTSWVTEFWDHSVNMDFPFKSLGSSVELVGSCNGLVCIWNNERDFFCFWNPATKEYAKVPKSPNHVSFDCYTRIHYAFGHDYKTDDYKLMILLNLDDVNYGSSSVEVYSLLSNSWKSNQTIPYRFLKYLESGIFVNGAFHWLVKPHDSAEAIVSLDISNERFEEIQLPDESIEIISLGMLEGCLCVLVDYPDVCVEVWVLQDYGVRESWTRRYIIKNEHILNHMLMLRLMWSFGSGEVVFELRGNPILYDPRCDSVTYPNIETRDAHNREEIYFETLVPLNSGTYVGRERMKDLEEDDACEAD